MSGGCCVLSESYGLGSVREYILNSTGSDKESEDTVLCRKEVSEMLNFRWGCLFMAVVATEPVVSTTSVHTRIGGVLPSAVQALGTGN